MDSTEHLFEGILIYVIHKFCLIIYVVITFKYSVSNVSCDSVLLFPFWVPSMKLLIFLGNLMSSGFCLHNSTWACIYGRVKVACLLSIIQGQVVVLVSLPLVHGMVPVCEERYPYLNTKRPMSSTTKICSWEGSSHIFGAMCIVTLGFLKRILVKY